MAKLKDLIENELSALSVLMVNERLFSYGVSHIFNSIHTVLTSICEVMTNNMPIEYLDTEISKLYPLICDLNKCRATVGTELTVTEHTTILWHRHMIRKIVIQLIQAIEN